MSELEPIEQIKAVLAGGYKGAIVGEMGHLIFIKLPTVFSASSFVQMLADDVQKTAKLILEPGILFMQECVIEIPKSDDPFGTAEMIRKANAG